MSNHLRVRLILIISNIDYKDIVKPSVSDNVKLLYGMPARTNSSGMKQSKLAPSFVGKTTEEE
jgi:hypothetical protein